MKGNRSLELLPLSPSIVLSCIYRGPKSGRGFWGSSTFVYTPYTYIVQCVVLDCLRISSIELLPLSSSIDLSCIHRGPKVSEAYGAQVLLCTHHVHSVQCVVLDCLRISSIELLILSPSIVLSCIHRGPKSGRGFWGSSTFMYKPYI